MAVNLNGIDLRGPAPGAARELSQSSKAAQAAPRAGADPDAAQPAEVSITSTAALLSHLGQALSAQPAVDQGRVAAVSKVVEDGSYRVQPEAVAAGLLQSERTLSPLPFTEI